LRRRRAHRPGRVRAHRLREKTTTEAGHAKDKAPPRRIREFQFRDIRPQAASEIDDLPAASQLSRRAKEQIIEKI